MYDTHFVLGVYDSGCSKEEYVFQHFFKFQRKDHNLQATYLSPEGGMNFNFLRYDSLL